MYTPVDARLAAVCLVGSLLLPQQLSGADEAVRLIVHPTRVGRLSEAQARAIYLKQQLFWDDGSPIIPINLEAGSDARELFSERVFGQGSRRLAGYWNQRYFEAGEFPPATLASEEAVIRFVAGNRNALGYVVGAEPDESVRVILMLDR
jgi:ABC-type phosphate transport system substrate-binding protein